MRKWGFYIYKIFNKRGKSKLANLAKYLHGGLELTVFRAKQLLTEFLQNENCKSGPEYFEYWVTREHLSLNFM